MSKTVRALRYLLTSLGVAFLGMLVQVPLIQITLPLEKAQGHYGKMLGNVIFWTSFVLIGQPLAALLYFFAWQAKYGSDLRTGGKVEFLSA